VGVEVDASGDILIHGNESGGRYTGVVDPRSGELVGVEVWR
jgi:hypothetical protein